MSGCDGAVVSTLRSPHLPKAHTFHPFPLFQVVKGIVFFTFFQNWCISVYFHIFPPEDMEVTVGALQSTIMCIEMLIFAIMHAFAFSYIDFPRVTELEASNDQLMLLAGWAKYYARARLRWKVGTASWWRMVFRVMCNLRDVREDTRETWQHVKAEVDMLQIPKR